jgi:hypothetical protein
MTLLFHLDRHHMYRDRFNSRLFSYHNNRDHCHKRKLPLPHRRVTHSKPQDLCARQVESRPVLAPVRRRRKRLH